MKKRPEDLMPANFKTASKKFSSKVDIWIKLSNWMSFSRVPVLLLNEKFYMKFVIIWNSKLAY